MTTEFESTTGVSADLGTDGGANAPRRRRAASRPAGAPEAPPAEAPAVVELPALAGSVVTDIVVSTSSAHRRPRRRRATEAAPFGSVDRIAAQEQAAQASPQTRQPEASEPIAGLSEPTNAADFEASPTQAASDGGSAPRRAPRSRNRRGRGRRVAEDTVSETSGAMADGDISASADEHAAHEQGVRSAFTGAPIDDAETGPELAAVPVVVPSITAPFAFFTSETADTPAVGSVPPAPASMVLFQAPQWSPTPPAPPAAAASELDEEPVDELDEENAIADDVDGDEEEDANTRRRRRRRGGRGRKRRGDETAEDEATLDDDAVEVEDDAVVEDADAVAADEEDGSGTRTRRRRRRRRGAEPEPDSAAEERTRYARDVSAVKGSTRLEARRQRRRDTRDSHRRRHVVTEAEFLARRESVDRKLVVREGEGRTQVAVLEDDILVEHYVARKSQTSMIGNVYVGRVQNVLPSMEAAFVDVGRGRNAVLYAGEVNWDSAGLDGQPRRIELALKSGDPVLVQVTKDPVGHKGARLTSQISLPGRYLVYVPGSSMTGISRKLPDTERARLKKILKAVVPEDAGVIVRTAAEGASEEELMRDVQRLQKQWARIEKKQKSASPPSLLYREPDLAVKIIRDVFNEDFKQLTVSGEEAWTTIGSYVADLAPDLSERVVQWDASQGDIYDALRINEQIAKAVDRKVYLPSGGSLVIDRTEAMTVIDVNTGKFVGSGGNLEATVTKNNLEAAEEIVRQLRLRDIGGIIVVDFIDMVLESNRDLVLRRLLECLSRDRTKHQVAEVTSLGLVQMTRKRLGQGLVEAYSQPCNHCDGRGIVVEPIGRPKFAHRPAVAEAETKTPEPAKDDPEAAKRREQAAAMARVAAAARAAADPAHEAAVERDADTSPSVDSTSQDVPAIESDGDVRSHETPDVVPAAERDDVVESVEVEVEVVEVVTVEESVAGVADTAHAQVDEASSTTEPGDAEVDESDTPSAVV